jgi:6,7-dimethyl-8-ribityllumazine synthase
MSAAGRPTRDGPTGRSGNGSVDGAGGGRGNEPGGGAGNGLDGRAVDAAGLRLAIVAARWHGATCDRLLARAQAAAAACGVTDLAVLRVDGAWELPVAAQAVAESADALVVLGCIIRGGTPHFDHLCASVYNGLLRVSLDAGIPLGNGVLTCETPAQAADRDGGPGAAEDKGWQATIAALDAARALRADACAGDLPTPLLPGEPERGGRPHTHRLRRRLRVHNGSEA